MQRRAAAQDQPVTAATQLLPGSPARHRGALRAALLALVGPPQPGTEQKTLGGKLVVSTLGWGDAMGQRICDPRDGLAPTGTKSALSSLRARDVQCAPP